MPSIGNTTQGSTLDSGYAGYKSASPVQMSLSEDGSLSGISLWMKITGATTTCRAMVYADNGGVPGALLGTSADRAIPVSDTQQAFVFGTSVPLLAGVIYWLCVGFDSGGGSVGVYCSPSGTGKHDYTANSAATNPFGSATVAGSAGQMSISATYTAGASVAAFPNSDSVVLDNFNRANGAAGSDWGEIDPSYPIPSIASNQMAGTNSHSGYWNHVMPNDQEIYMHLTTAMSANMDYVLMARITGSLPTTSENGYCAYFDTASVTIKRSDAGVKTVLATFAVVPGAWIGMRVTGNVIRVFTSSDGITWTLIGSVTDNTYTSGLIGWFFNSFVSGTAFSFDDFGGTLAIVFVNGTDSNGTTTETGTQSAGAVSPYVKEVGKAADHVITLVVPISAAPDAASTLIMRIGFRASGTATITSITDTKGGTWSVDVENDLSNGHAAVASTKQDAGALTTADSVSITFSATPSNGSAAIIDEFTGVDNSGTRVGQTATGTGSGTTRGAGTTATTPTADEVIVSAYAGNGAESSLTEDAAFSPFTTDALTYGTTAFVSGEYRVVAATGAYSAPAVGTFSGSTTGAMATYKLAAVGSASKAGTDAGSGSSAVVQKAAISATAQTDTESEISSIKKAVSETNASTTETGNQSHAIVVSDTGGTHDDPFQLDFLPDTDLLPSDSLLPGDGDIQGSGENAILGAVLPVSDASVASGEVGALALNYIVANTGGDAEATTLKSVVSGSQTSTGVDTGSTTSITSFVGTESGGDSEATTLKARTTGNENPTGVDIASQRFIFTVADFNADSEAMTLKVVVGGNENPTVTDTGVANVHQLFGTDVGTSTITGTLRFVFTASDSDSDSEASSLSAKANGSDTAGGSESTNKGQEVVEAGSGSDDGTQTVLWLSSDSASSLDTAVYVASLISAELASLVEDGTISVSCVVDDFGDGEAEAIFGFTLTDAGAGSDSVFIAKLFFGDDFGIGHDAFQIHRGTQFPEHPPQIITATEMIAAILLAATTSRPSIVKIGSGFEFDFLPSTNELPNISLLPGDFNESQNSRPKIERIERVR
jgi:hypothetical protein